MIVALGVWWEPAGGMMRPLECASPECASSNLDLANEMVWFCHLVLLRDLVVRLCRALYCWQSATACLGVQLIWTPDVGCVCFVWAGDVAEEEPEEEDEHLGNLDEEEIKKMQSDEVLSLLFLLLFWFFWFFLTSSFIWSLTILNRDEPKMPRGMNMLWPIRDFPSPMQ